MEIGDKEVTIYSADNSFLRFDTWNINIEELSKEIVYIERELVGYSNAGTGIYFRHRFIKNNSYVTPSEVSENQCTAIYCDIWVHHNDTNHIIHLRDYHQSKFTDTSIIFIPFECNIRMDGYGQKFTPVRLRNKNGIERDIFLSNILNLKETLFKISQYETWEEYLANQYVEYMSNKIDHYFTSILEYLVDWQKLYHKFYTGYTNFKDAKVNIRISIDEWLTVYFREYSDLKDKYLNKKMLSGATLSRLSSDIENKIEIYEGYLRPAMFKI